MQKELILKQIVQADKKGALMFTEPGETIQTAGGPQRVTPGTSVAVQLPDPKEAAEYEHGATYKITIEKM